MKRYDFCTETQNARGLAPGVRVTKFAGPGTAPPPSRCVGPIPHFPGPPLRADAETPLPWRVSGAADGRDPSKPLGRLIPLMETLTKRLRGAAWILNQSCGYRATNLIHALSRWS